MRLTLEEANSLIPAAGIPGVALVLNSSSALLVELSLT